MPASAALLQQLAKQLHFMQAQLGTAYCMQSIPETLNPNSEAVWSQPPKPTHGLDGGAPIMGRLQRAWLATILAIRVGSSRR
jgi:hypothetical protein